MKRREKGAAIPLIGFDEKLKRQEEIQELMEKLESESRQIEQESIKTELSLDMSEIQNEEMIDADYEEQKL